MKLNENVQFQKKRQAIHDSDSHGERDVTLELT